MIPVKKNVQKIEEDFFSQTEIDGFLPDHS